MITTRVSELYVYDDDLIIGHVNHHLDGNWQSWFVMHRDGPKTTYQMIPGYTKTQQEAVAVTVEAYTS